VTSETLEVNEVLDSHIIQLNLCIPKYIVIQKGVIKDVPDDMELENLMQQLNSDKHNKQPVPFQIIGAARLKMGVKETNEETKEERWA
jgi:hypothetical protein